MKKYTIIYFLIFLINFIFFFWVGFLLERYKVFEKITINKQMAPAPTIEQQQPDTNTLNQSNVLRYATKIGVKFPEVYLRQCIMESGHKFNSLIAQQYNNIHGMHRPRVRQSTNIATVGRYAKYESWKHCVQDYKLWQDMHKGYIKEIDCQEDYICFLRYSGYLGGARKTYEKELLTLKLRL